MARIVLSLLRDAMTIKSDKSQQTDAYYKPHSFETPHCEDDGNSPFDRG